MKKYQGQIILAVAALIWGCAFVFQSTGMEHIGPWTFSCIRSFIASFTLFLIMPLMRRIKGEPEDESHRRFPVKEGLICGTALAAATICQQTGIQFTTVGKAGFLSSLYVLGVPLLSAFGGKRIRANVWVAVLFACTGLYFMSLSGGFSIGKGDLLIMACALLFSVQIIFVGKYSGSVDGVKLSCMQFLTTGILCFVPMIVFEHPEVSQILAAAVPLLYVGVMSSAVAYTMQIIGQRTTDASVASIIMSLESVFAALAGLILLHQHLLPRELIGCALIFAGILLAQAPERKAEKIPAVSQE